MCFEDAPLLGPPQPRNHFKLRMALPIVNGQIIWVIEAQS
jgi:hypothetical protein